MSACSIRLPAVAAALLLAACAQPPQGGGGAAEQFVGRPYPDLERAFGQANRTEALAEGGWRVTYLRERQRFAAGAPAFQTQRDSMGGISTTAPRDPAQQVMDSCETVFTVSAQRIVSAARQNGSACNELMVPR